MLSCVYPQAPASLLTYHVDTDVCVSALVTTGSDYEDNKTVFLCVSRLTTDMRFAPFPAWRGAPGFRGARKRTSPWCCTRACSRPCASTNTPAPRSRSTWWCSRTAARFWPTRSRALLSLSRTPGSRCTIWCSVVPYARTAPSYVGRPFLRRGKQLQLGQRREPGRSDCRVPPQPEPDLRAAVRWRNEWRDSDGRGSDLHRGML